MCIYLEDIDDLRESYLSHTDSYLDISNKFRLSIFLKSENLGGFVDFQDYNSKILIHEVPTMFLAYLENNNSYEQTKTIFVSDKVLELWWQDVDVWVNLPDLTIKTLTPMSTHLSFFSFEDLYKEVSAG